jgi:putative SOS response-associated peptidase YedK
MAPGPGEKKKTPYRIKTDDDFFFMAGLWDYWAPQKMVSFAILTTEPNELIAQLHNRMPVILQTQDASTWLDSQNHDLSQLKALLKPYPAINMAYQPYDRYVSSAVNKDPNFIVPVGDPVTLGR